MKTNRGQFSQKLLRAVSGFIRLVWAVVVLLAVCVLWLVLFILFLPFLIVSALLAWRTKLTAPNGKDAEVAALNGPLPSAEASGNDQFIFDRRNDVSKVYGCNTRSVKYRWTIFASRLDEIRARLKEPHALDFGAGSLRDSYELAKLGFRVVSVDLDSGLLKSYSKAYDWSRAGRQPEFYTGPFEKLGSQPDLPKFDLALSFDVIEHLEDPAGYLRQLHPLLADSGFLFVIVPNRFSLFERYFKRSLRKQRRLGVALQRGVPHLQFKSPAEWTAFFEAQGFRTVEHDMTLGFLVNDVWNGLLTIPIRSQVTPELSRAAGLLGVRFDAGAFEQLFVPAWLMERVHVLDMLLARPLRNRFGWNLLVVQKDPGHLESSQPA